MNAPNTGIPYVPEGTLDPAAGLNLALDVIDALTQTQVISMALTAPPGGEQDGDLYIPAAGASGAWAGHAGDLARFVAEGAFWQFLTRGAQVRLIVNRDDGRVYVWDGTASPSLWQVIQANAAPAQVFNTASANTDADPTNAGRYTRFTHATGTYTFDDADSFVVGDEYHGRNAGSGTLTITEAGAMTVNPPTDGTLVIPAGGTFTVKIVAADEADLIGVTVPV